MAQDAYFEMFDTIEIQKTFYQPPRPSTAERWRRKAPDGFTSTLKAWQCITHYPSSPTYRRANIPDERKRRCGGFQANEVVMEAWQTTREIARILQAPVVVFQCPASLEPSGEHLDNMRRFFQEIERSDLLLGWEPRGDAWTDDLVAELCEALDLVHVVDPFKRPPVSGLVNYLRLHGVGGYRYEYTDEDLEELRGFIDRDEAYCMFNNSSMVADAQRFAELVSD
jgi:uncharacterized protein YecE (DUF72 family)